MNSNPIDGQAPPSVTGSFAGIERLLAQRPIILQLLRFAAIGVLNTSLDFILLNFLSKGLGITHGVQLGTVNIPGFVLAIIQSYLWNRAWAFEEKQDTGLSKNFGRLVLVGGLGVLALAAVLFGAGGGTHAVFYLIVLAIFIAIQALLWFSFGLSLGESKGNTQLFAFIIVSVIGLIINSYLLSYLSGYAEAHHIFATKPDLIKNMAKIVATGASLVWNFIGYKLFVFRHK
jgi:putative flippase GtrA